MKKSHKKMNKNTNKCGNFNQQNLKKTPKMDFITKQIVKTT